MNTVFFDMDGTLLPMDMKEFTDTYMTLLENRLISAGYDNAKQIIAGIWVGVKAMVDNTGVLTNEDCFWKAFRSYLTDDDSQPDRKYFRKLQKEVYKFYNEDFAVTRFISHPTDLVTEIIEILKQKGYQLVVATNPIFPETATLQRLSWCGLNPEDFSLITTYENSCFAKPNLNYYRHLMRTLDKDPEDCLMVGNDVHEDMCARKLGMDVFLIDEYMINEYDEDIFDLKKGSWKLFKEYVSSLPSLN